MSLQTVQAIGLLVGQPHGALKDVSIAIYLGVGTFNTLCFVYLRLYYERKPMNIACLRFILDPRHELARVDAAICHRLDAISSSLQVYNSRLVQQPGRTSRLDNHSLAFEIKHYSRAVELASSRELEHCSEIEERLREFRANPTELRSFRPEIFTPAYFASSTGAAQLLAVASQITVLVVNAILTVDLTYFTYSSKCPSLRCNPLLITSFSEALMFIEPIPLMITACISAALNNTSIISARSISSSAI